MKNETSKFSDQSVVNVLMNGWIIFLFRIMLFTKYWNKPSSRGQFLYGDKNQSLTRNRVVSVNSKQIIKWYLLHLNPYLFQIDQCILIQPCIFELQIVKWTDNFI